MQTFTCPSGEAFNHETSQCQDASTFDCIETMGDHSHHHHHHHHKRAIEEYHTIDVQLLKTTAIETFRAIRPIILEAFKTVAPTMYAKFENDYAPAIKDFSKDVLPFFQQKVLPQIQKHSQFALHILAQVIEKAYESYQMSNSTHINVVSFSDVANEISNEIKPILDLGRYLTARVLKENEKVENKRSSF